MSQFIRARKAAASIFYNDGSIGPTLRKSLADYSHLEVEALASSQWGYGYFPVVGRYVKNLGLDFLGMTAKFHIGWSDFGSYKNQAALEYETRQIMAHGGRVSVGDQLYPDGQLQPYTYDRIGKVFENLKMIEPYCDQAKAITDFAILLTKTNDKGRFTDEMAGAVSLLRECHYLFDIIDGEMDFNRYPVLILSDVADLDDTLIVKLNRYVAGGGKILCSGLAPVKDNHFVFDDFPARYLRGSINQMDYLKLPAESEEHIMYAGGEQIELMPGAQLIARQYRPLFNRTFEHYYGHVQAPIDWQHWSSGVVMNEHHVYFANRIFSLYHAVGAKFYKTLVSDLLDQMLPQRVYLAENERALKFNYSNEELKVIIPEMIGYALVVIDQK